jgi:hypothetical protein
MKLLDYLKEKGFERLLDEPFMNPSNAGSCMTFEQLFEGFLKANEPKTFEQAAEPMMKYLAENHHPHTMAEIESNKAILWEGQQSYHNDDFLVD